MTVLLEVNAGKVQLVVRCDFGRRSRLRGRRGWLVLDRRLGLVREQFVAVARSDDEPKMRGCRTGRERHVRHEGLVGRQVHAPLEQRLTIPHHEDRRVRNVACHGDTDARCAVLEAQAGGRIEVGMACRPDFLDRVPVLAE